MANTYQATKFTGEQLDNFMGKVLDKSIAGRGLTMDEDGAMHCIAPNYWKLAYTYTHKRNFEVHPTALNLETGEFTAPAHGLSSGQMLFVAVDEPYHMLAPYDFLPGGLTIGNQASLRVLNRYSATVVDANTFKITAVGQTEPMTFTEVSTMDLSKFHFEEWVTSDIMITDLPDLTEALLVIQGRVASSYKYVLPNNYMNYGSKIGFTNFDNYSGSADNSGASYIGYRSGWGGVYTTIEIKFIGDKHLLQSKVEDTHCFSPENVGYAYHNRTYTHRSMKENFFNQISFEDGGCFFNGSTIKIYIK